MPCFMAKTLSMAGNAPHRDFRIPGSAGAIQEMPGGGKPGGPGLGKACGGLPQRCSAASILPVFG